MRSVLGAKGQADDPGIGLARSFRARRTNRGDEGAGSDVTWQAIFAETPPLAVFGAMSEPRVDRNVNARPGSVESTDLVVAFIGDWRSATEAANHLPTIENGASLIVARSGRVTAANVQENATALRRAGASPVGIVVIGPDRFDTSTGQLGVPLSSEPAGTKDDRTEDYSEPEPRALRRL